MFAERGRKRSPLAGLLEGKLGTVGVAKWSLQSLGRQESPVSSLWVSGGDMIIREPRTAQMGNRKDWTLERECQKDVYREKPGKEPFDREIDREELRQGG